MQIHRLAHLSARYWASSSLPASERCSSPRCLALAPAHLTRFNGCGKLHALLPRCLSAHCLLTSHRTCHQQHRQLLWQLAVPASACCSAPAPAHPLMKAPHIDGINSLRGCVGHCGNRDSMCTARQVDRMLKSTLQCVHLCVRCTLHLCLKCKQYEGASSCSST